MINFISFLISSVLWVQVPQWSDDWSKCAVDVPDSSCHWYITAPDNTFGEGFDWASAPWFDANGLSDVPSIEKNTALQKLQLAHRHLQRLYYSIPLTVKLIIHQRVD